MNYALRHEGVWRSGCIAPYFLDLGTNWSFTHLPLYSRGKSPWHQLDRRLSEPQSRSGQFGEERILDPIGTRNPTPEVVQPVASRYTDYDTQPQEHIT
jgi:hypothetical protein